MPVRPIIPSVESNNSAKNKIKPLKNQNVSFQGNPIISSMDLIDRGGFIGAFILQDFLGMVLPRFITGMLRNHDKTGELNWDFARREGLREVTSGPSTILIPMAILPIAKKFFGSANNVPIDFINGFGETFSDFVKADKNVVLKKSAREDLYAKFFENIISSSTEGKVAGEELKDLASSYSKRLLEIEDPQLSPKKSIWKIITGAADPNSKQDKIGSLVDDFVSLRKKHIGLDADAYSAFYKTEKGEAAASLKSVLSYMGDFADDVLSSAKSKIASAADLNIEEFVKEFSKKRTGSRLLTNISMFLGVAAVFTVLPKLYNLGIKGSRDPGLDGLDNSNKNPSPNPTFGKPEEQVASDGVAKNPSFTGMASKIGELVEKHPKFKLKISNPLEFDGPSIGPMAMMTLLFGGCLPPRIINAKSNYELKEIIVRDVTSFLAILFAGKALSRGFTKLSSKISGLVLSQNPAKHSTILQKLKNYFAPDGIRILSSPDIVSKYSNLRDIKGGFNGFVEFINKNNGNIQKVLGNIDENVAKATERILGKPVKDASVSEIVNAFKNAQKTHPDEMETIYKAFDSADNKFVTRAKNFNSSFNLASNILLVPLLMIGLAKYCENMTAKNYAKNNKKQGADQYQLANAQPINPSSKPTMAGFLAR